MLSAIYAAKRHSDEGFTLLELLIVVVVIGVLAAIALPVFLNQQKAAIDASVQSDVRNSVAQLTGAQATKDATFKVTVSRSDTTLALADTTDNTKNGSVVGSAATQTLNTPASGDVFTLTGSNPSGSKFQGSNVTGGKAFVYDGATGKFSDGTAATGSGGSGSGGGSGSSSTSVVSWDMENAPDSTKLQAYPHQGASVITVSDAHSGSQVINLPGGSAGNVDLFLPAADFTAGKTYTLSVWVRGGGTVITNPNDGYTNKNYTTAVTAQWQKISNPITSPTDGTRATFFSISHSNYGEPDIQLDDFELTEN